MKRRFLTLLSLLSLVLCLAIFFMWMRGQFRRELIRYSWSPTTQASRQFDIESDLGVLYFGLSAYNGPNQPPAPASAVHVRSNQQLLSNPGVHIDMLSNTVLRFFGSGDLINLHYGHLLQDMGGGNTIADYGLVVPEWLAVALTAVIPSVRFWRRRTIKPGLCRKCGYDLRSSPGRCPECGNDPPKKA